MRLNDLGGTQRRARPHQLPRVRDQRQLATIVIAVPPRRRRDDVRRRRKKRQRKCSDARRDVIAVLSDGSHVVT